MGRARLGGGRLFDPCQQVGRFSNPHARPIFQSAVPRSRLPF
jgi:hypothetical protein